MIRMNIRRSFSTKLSLWILLMAVPVFCASVGLLFYQSRRMIQREAVERANVMLDASLQRINRYLVTVETASNTYSWLIQRSMQPDSTFQPLFRWLCHQYGAWCHSPVSAVFHGLFYQGGR